MYVSTGAKWGRLRPHKKYLLFFTKCCLDPKLGLATETEACFTLDASESMGETSDWQCSVKQALLWKCWRIRCHIVNATREEIPFVRPAQMGASKEINRGERPLQENSRCVHRRFQSHAQFLRHKQRVYFSRWKRWMMVTVNISEGCGSSPEAFCWSVRAILLLFSASHRPNEATLARIHVHVCLRQGSYTVQNWFLFTCTPLFENGSCEIRYTTTFRDLWTRKELCTCD